MRKPRIDSRAEAVRIMSKANQEIVPPLNVPLDDRDMPFFSSVIAEFARADWSAHQLELAAMLARTMADLEREQRELRVEGSVAYSEKGTPVVNPRKILVQMHAGTILSFRKSLALNARAQTKDQERIATRHVVAKSIETTLDDDLIARPN